MNKLTLVKAEHFGEIEADIYSNGKEMFMTINQLAECLEYADKKSVENIIDRNRYLKNKEFSFLQKVPLITGGYSKHTRFHRGWHLRSDDAVQAAKGARVPCMDSWYSQSIATR